MRKRCQEGVTATVGLRLLFFGNLAVADVFDREQDHLSAVLVTIEPMSVQQDSFFADVAKIMGNFEIPQSIDFRQDSHEQVAKAGNVPFAVSEIKEALLQGF